MDLSAEPQVPDHKGRPSRVQIDDVLDEAARLFHTQGYHNTRMKDIAASFGVTHAALYYHFRNKQDLLARINIRELEALLRDATSILTTETPAVDKFLQIVRAHLLFVAEDPPFAAALFDHDNEMPEPEMSQLVQLRRVYTEILVQLYEDCAAAGYLPQVDAQIAVSMIIGACNWTCRWYTPAGPLKPDKLADVGMELIGSLVRNHDGVLVERR